MIWAPKSLFFSFLLGELLVSTQNLKTLVNFHSNSRSNKLGHPSNLTPSNKGVKKKWIQILLNSFTSCRFVGMTNRVILNWVNLFKSKFILILSKNKIKIINSVRSNRFDYFRFILDHRSIYSVFWSLNFHNLVYI